MVIKGEWASPCPDCGAMKSCCETSIMRRDIGADLSLLVGRQSVQITELRRQLDEARQVIGDIRSGNERLAKASTRFDSCGNQHEGRCDTKCLTDKK